jgi:hypothetical protein
MAANRFGFKIDKGLSTTFSTQYIVASGSVGSISSGTPTECVTADASVAGVITTMADGGGVVTAMRFTGLAKDTSTDTAAAAGICNTWAPAPGLLYRGKPLVAGSFDTQAEINALMGKKVLFDLTSSNWTIDSATADALINCVVIQGGYTHTDEGLFIYSSKGTIWNTATAI